MDRYDWEQLAVAIDKFVKHAERVGPEAAYAQLNSECEQLDALESLDRFDDILADFRMYSLPEENGSHPPGCSCGKGDCPDASAWEECPLDRLREKGENV